MCSRSDLCDKAVYCKTNSMTEKAMHPPLSKQIEFTSGSDYTEEPTTDFYQETNDYYGSKFDSYSKRHKKCVLYEQFRLCAHSKAETFEVCQCMRFHCTITAFCNPWQGNEWSFFSYKWYHKDQPSKSLFFLKTRSMEITFLQTITNDSQLFCGVAIFPP